MFGFTFSMTPTSTFSAILILCLVVSRLHGNDAGVSGLLLLFFIDIPTQNLQETHSTLNKQPNEQLSKKMEMALLSPKQQSKTKVSSATSQMTSSPRSPRAASSQAFSAKTIGDVAETNGKTRSARVTRNS